MPLIREWREVFRWYGRRCIVVPTAPTSIPLPVVRAAAVPLAVAVPVSVPPVAPLPIPVPVAVVVPRAVAALFTVAICGEKRDTRRLA